MYDFVARVGGPDDVPAGWEGRFMLRVGFA